MSAANQATDLMANLPVWAQVAASLGMFLVAVIAAAIGFSRRIAPWMSGSSGATSGVSEAAQLHHDDLLAGANSTLQRIAGALEGIHTNMEERAREDAIDREVKRRLQEHGVKGATK